MLHTHTVTPTHKVTETVERIVPGLNSLFTTNPADFQCDNPAAVAESLQYCPTLYDPIDSSPSGSPIPGFSSQEHWSGLPFPSPMHESEK